MFIGDEAELTEHVKVRNMNILNRFREKSSKWLWQFLLRLANDDIEKLGPIEVYFCAHHDNSWLQSQKLAIKEAEKLLLHDLAVKYKQVVFGEITNVIFRDAGNEKYDAKSKCVIMKYEPDLSDNYIYLASRLIEIATLMKNQYSNNISQEDRCRDAKEQQLAFLSLFPEADKIRDWVTKKPLGVTHCMESAKESRP